MSKKCVEYLVQNHLPLQLKNEAEINHIQFELNAFNHGLIELNEVCFYTIIAKYLNDETNKIKDDFKRFLQKLEFAQEEIDRIISSFLKINELDKYKDEDKVDKDQFNSLIDIEKDFFYHYKIYVRKTTITPSQYNILVDQKYFLMKLGQTFFCKIKSLLASQTDTLINSFFKNFVGFIYEVSIDTNDDRLKENLLAFLSIIDNDQLQLKMKFVEMAQLYESQNPKIKQIPFSFDAILIDEFISCCQQNQKQKILDYTYGTLAVDFNKTNQISNQSQIDFVDALSRCIQNQADEKNYKTLAFLSRENRHKCVPFYEILQSKFKAVQNVVDQKLMHINAYIAYYLSDAQDLQVLALFKDPILKDKIIHLLYEFYHEVKEDKIKLIIKGMYSDQAVTYQKMEKLLNEIQNYDHILLHFFLEECLLLFPQNLGANGNNNKIRVLRFLKNHHLFGKLLSTRLVNEINKQVLDQAIFSYFEFLTEDDVIAYFNQNLNQNTFLLNVLEKDYIHSNYRYYIDMIIPFLKLNQNTSNATLKVLSKNSFVEHLTQQDIQMIENRIISIFQTNQINHHTITAFNFIKTFENENNIPLNSTLEMNKLIDHFFGFNLENIPYAQKNEMYKTYYQEVQISLLEAYIKNYLKTYQEEILSANDNALYGAFKDLTDGLFTNTIHLMSIASVNEIYDLILTYCDHMFKHMNDPINSPLNINLSKLNFILDLWLLPLKQILDKSSIVHQPILPSIQSNLFYNPQWNIIFPLTPNQAPNPMFAYACLLDFIYKLNPNEILEINSISKTVSLHIQDLIELQITRSTRSYRDISSLIKQLSDFIKSSDCPEHIIFNGIELVMPTSEILVEYLNENQSIADEHKKEFLLSMNYILCKALPEITELKKSQDLRDRWVAVYQYKTIMKMQKVLSLKYPQNQIQIELIIGDFQKQLCLSDPDEDFTSNLFQRIKSKFFPRSFHVAIQSLPSQFDIVDVEKAVFGSTTEISIGSQAIQVASGHDFEEVLYTYFTLRYTIANYLRFFDEYGPYQDILKQGFNEIFTTKKLQQSFEDKSDQILEKLYLKKVTIKIEEMKQNKRF